MCTTQAMHRRIKDFAKGHSGSEHQQYAGGPCYRCISQEQSGKHKGFGEPTGSGWVDDAWTALEALLDSPEVAYMMQSMTPLAHADVQGLCGKRLGFVVEAHVVPGERAADIYVPWLKLVIQVDGECHSNKRKRDQDTNRDTDKKFVAACKLHKIHLLRLWWDDNKFFDLHIKRVVMYCLSQPGNTLCAGSNQHPLVATGDLVMTQEFD